MADRPGELEQSGRRARVRHWEQADVRCMQCGRAIGRLLAGSQFHRELPSSVGPQFVFFRSAQPDTQTRRLYGGERFRCATCGGNGVIEELEPFATEVITGQECDRPPRGRRPKRWVPRGDWRLEAFQLRDEKSRQGRV